MEIVLVRKHNVITPIQSVIIRSNLPMRIMIVLTHNVSFGRSIFDIFGFRNTRVALVLFFSMENKTTECKRLIRFKLNRYKQSRRPHPIASHRAASQGRHHFHCLVFTTFETKTVRQNGPQWWRTQRLYLRQ
jgi:hypothetical protein